MYSCKYTWIIKALINIITRINVSIYKINTHIFVCIHEQTRLYTKTIKYSYNCMYTNYNYSYNCMFTYVEYYWRHAKRKEFLRSLQ